MDQVNTFKSSTTQKDSQNSPDPTTVIPANKRAPSLDYGQSTKNGDMWTLKYDIRSPKFYLFLINKKLKGDTPLDLKNFYNHINMCLNAVKGLLE